MSIKNKNSGHSDIISAVKRQYYRLIMIYNIISMILYTLYTLFIIYFNWGNTVYITVILSVLGLYVALFLLTLIMERNRSAINRKFKDYRSGLKIIKALMSIANFALTITVFTSAIVSNDFDTVFKAIVLIISLAWAVFQINYQVSRIIKRRRANKRHKRQPDKTDKKEWK